MKLARWRTLKNQTGMMLITTLGLLATITVLSAAFLQTSLTEVKAAEKLEQRMIAFHWAEGAMDQTIVALRTNAAYTGVPSTAGTGRVSGNYLSTVTSLGNNVYKVSSTGSIAGSYSVLSQNRTLEAYVTLAPSSPFKTAIFSNHTIAMSGNAVVDAYDSRIGPYSPQTATSEGHVGSNWKWGYGVALAGNAKIKGNVTVGPSSNLAIATITSGNARITGTVTAASTATVLPPVVISGTHLGAISISGNSVQTLAPGTYSASSLVITGNGKLRLSGATTLNVNGSVIIAGNNGIITASDLPTNLTLNVKGRVVALTGNSAFYGKIYAPDSVIGISGNASVYGSVIGNVVAHTGNGHIHYDKALNAAGGSSGSSKNVTYWTEL